MPHEPPQAVPLEIPRATQESWLEAVQQFVLEHMEALETAPAVGYVGAAGLRVADDVSRPIAETPLPGGIQEVMRLVARAVDASLVTPGPGYFAYVPGSGLFACALADLISGCVNRFTGVSAAAPALARLEADAIAWLVGEFGYPAGARGVLTSGGSLANLGGLVTARHAVLGDDGDFRRAIAYTSQQAHHCVVKALRVAGIPPGNVRALPTDAAFRLRPEELRSAIERDRASGHRPFAVVASAGTTNTGAVDPLDALADVCRDEELWLHVDAAYGGAFVLCPQGRAALAGIGRADSIAFDPHKGLFLPFGTGCLLVRDGRLLRSAHIEGAGYLQDFEAWDRTREAPNPADHGPELSRDGRGLRLWMPLVLHGVAPFRAALAEKLELALRFQRGLEALIERGLPIEIVARAQLSTVAFRLTRHAGESLDDWNRRNADWLVRINLLRRVYLSSTTLPVDDGDAFTLRVCVLGFRTHADRIDAGIEDLAAAAQ